jgi:hypothetical protein
LPCRCFSFYLSAFDQSGGLGQQFWYPDEVAGDHLECEEAFGLGEAPELELCGTADGLGPAEAFFDAFAATLADLVALVPGGAAVDSGVAELARLRDCAIDGDVWCDRLVFECKHESFGIVTLVGAKCDAGFGDSPHGCLATALDHTEGRLAFSHSGSLCHLAVNDQPVAVLHQGMTHEAQAAGLTIALAEQLRIGISL